MRTQPVVVIVGRPNVGKSTLFNRLTRSRRALVHDLPGVTRDRIIGEAPVPGRSGSITLIDTGGLLLGDEDRFVPLIRSQAEAAIRDADLVLLLLDGDAGPIPEDLEIAEYLRALPPPVVPVVNKADRRHVDLQAHEFFRLGLGEPRLISAEHGVGMDELWDAILEHLPEAGVVDGDQEAAGPAEGEVRVAIIGRPNVGKSSLLNRLVGEARALVSEVPGTTRDTVDVVVARDGVSFRFVDTAGIRRKGRTDRGPEVLSVVIARQALERADVCVLLLDAVEGVTRQDAHVGGYAWEAGRAMAVAVNKWDLMTDREEARHRLENELDQNLKYLRHAPTLYLSALTGRGVQRLFPMLRELAEAHRRRFTTGELNRILKEAWDRQPPPMGGRREPKLYYTTQVSSSPPGFVLFTNLTSDPHFSYLRYLENALRQELSLEGVPFRVMIKGRKS